MTATRAEVAAQRRPVATLWGRTCLDPLAAALVARLADRVGVSPWSLTAAGVGLALIAASLFWHGAYLALAAAALIFQASSVAERASGLLANLRPGAGSPGALIAAHSLAPGRSVACALALGWSEFARAGDGSVREIAAVGHAE